MNNNIATVAVEKTFFNIDSDFDYLIPDIRVSLVLRIIWLKKLKSEQWLKYLLETVTGSGTE